MNSKKFKQLMMYGIYAAMIWFIICILFNLNIFLYMIGFIPIIFNSIYVLCHWKKNKGSINIMYTLILVSIIIFVCKILMKHL